MTELAFAPAHELARLVRAKAVSSTELLALYLQRIERLNPAINALPVLDAERAQQQAGLADAALARGEIWGPLHGVPISVKESFNVAGLPTTYGFESHRHNIASQDAVAVHRLKQAGAVLLGKSNVPASLADWQSFNPVYGTTHNPWNLGCTPGGSSGGAAAALAAGLTALELGSDIGASIRNPAHYCGVWGHKPTWGVVPLAGHELAPFQDPDHFDIAVAGPLARSAVDLALAMDVLTHPLQASTPLGRLPMAWRDTGLPARRCRVAVMYTDPQAEVDHSVQAALRGLVDFLRREGVVVAEDACPVDTALSHRVYIHLLRAATGTHYEDAGYAQAMSRAQGFAQDDDSYPARHFRGITSNHRQWWQVDEQRKALGRQWAAFFQQHDLLICPTATTPAFAHNQQGERWERMVMVNGRPQPSTDALFWAGFPGVVGLPATAVPLGLSDQGLPVGAQIVAPLFADPQALRFAAWLEQAYRSFQPPPMAV